MVRLWLSRSRIKLQEWAIHELIYFHYCCFISTSIAIIWSREYCDDILLVTPIVSIHYKLMCSAHKTQAICLIELLANVLSKGISRTSWRNAPTHAIIRVRPKKITDGAFMWNFLHSIELFNLIESVDAGRKPSMQTENLVLNNRC
jgi:hypothetical protein